MATGVRKGHALSENDSHTQLVVVGGGPGGYAAAFLAADESMQVTLVEAETRLGGTCLLRGCIPSKALLHVARVIGEVDELRKDWGIEYPAPKIHIDTVRQRKEKVIATLSGGLKQIAKRRNVRVITARASFENSTTLRLHGDHDSIPAGGKLTYDHCILATGSAPSMPQAFELPGGRVIDSTGALQLEEVPATLLVVGGGYIGLEMATVYAQLGSKVTVVELTDGLLPGVDRDLVKPLHKHLENLLAGRIFLNTKVGSLGDRDNKVEAAFEGPGRFGTELFECVLVAIGRRPNSNELGLENTDVQLDERGFVICNRQQRTADAHILAIGDVAGEPMLAHKATHQGRVAVEALVGKPAEFTPRAIPAVVFTDPEIAWTGLTETEARRDEIPIEKAVYPWAASGRAQAIGRVEGLTKWLIQPDSGRVLGCGIVGSGAGELIAEATLAVEMGCEVHDIAQTIHAHPTLGETLMNAGEVFFGTATEIYKPRRRRN